MSDLKIKSVKITDAINTLSKTAKLMMAPASKVINPVAEYGFPSDTAGYTITRLRPTDNLITITANYSGDTSQQIFSGIIDFMDDIEDPDLFESAIDLSDVPPGRRYRNKFTKYVNLMNPYFLGSPSENAVNIPIGTDTYGLGTAHSLLKDLCKQIGIAFGRCDLPNYALVGNVEINHMTVMEVAEMLVTPFNTFPFVHYYPRLDHNGLQIIKIDYRQGGEVTNSYSIPASRIKTKKRTFEAYLPGTRIGNSDVLLNGGSLIGNVTDESSNNNAGGNHTNDVKIYEEKEFQYTVSNEGDARSAESLDGTTPTSPTDGGDATILSGSSVHTETTMNVIILFTGYNDLTVPSSWSAAKKESRRKTITGGTDTDPRYTQIPLSEYNSDGTATIEWGTVVYVESASIVVEEPLKVVTVKTIDSQYWNPDVETTTTTYTYQQIKVVSGPSFAEQKVNRRVISEVVTETTLVAGKGPEYNSYSLTRTKYYYDRFGNNITKITKTYSKQREYLVLVGVDTQTDQIVNLLTNVTAEYLDGTVDPNNIQPQSQGQLTGSELLQFQGVGGITVSTWSNTQTPNQSIFEATGSNGGSIRSTTRWGETIDQYRTLNGNPLRNMQNWWRNLPSHETASPNWDILRKTFWTAMLKSEHAFSISCPFMNYDGLALIYSLVTTERELESKSCYWEHVTITGIFDTTPVVGESIVLDGESLIMETVEHTLDENSALTSITGKRLIVQ